MQKKGTGWIPDLPDVRDYNLFTGPILDMVETSGNEATTHSLETLAYETTEALRELLKATPNDQAQTLLAKLEQSQQTLLSSTVFFQPVRVHQYLDRTTNSPEVVRIKAYLKKFLLELSADVLTNLEHNSPDDYYLIKTLKSDFDWWLGQQTDEKFTQLVKLYQDQKTSDPENQPPSLPRYPGYIDPETLAFFEQEPNTRLYTDQITVLNHLVEDINRITLDTVEQFNQQLAAAQIKKNMFYDLQDIPVDFPDLQKRFEAIQKQFHRRYVDAVLPKETLDLIQEFEDLRLQAYPEPNGLWVMGYGHRIPACPSRAITETEAKTLLEQDLIRLILDHRLANIQKLCPPTAFAALLSFIHHIGSNAFLSSTLFHQLQGHNFDLEAVAQELKRWNQVNDQESPLLQNRRLEEANLLLNASFSTLELSEELSATQTAMASPSTGSASYRDHYVNEVAMLIVSFKQELIVQVKACQATLIRLRDTYPVIQRKTMACPLPEEINQDMFQGIMTVVRNSFQLGDLEKAKQDKEISKLGLGKDVDQVFQHLIQNTDLSVNQSELQELRELLDPLIQSLVRMFSPMGIHTTIQRTIAEAVDQFQQFLDQHGLVRVGSSVPISLRYAQPLDPVSQTRIAAAMREAKQRAEQQLQEAKVALALATQHQQYDIFKVDPELAQKKVAKLFLVLRIIAKIERCCPFPGPSPQFQSSSRPAQPTLLFVPPPDQAGAATQPTALRNFSDALQMPISCHLRRELQQFFREQGRSESQGKTWLYLSLPEIVDLSYWCSAIEDQGQLNACTAHAGVALVEYFAKKSFGRYEDLSRLFLYKVARNLMHRLGDAGASVRETMRAMVLFGIPPEDRWPYEEADFDEEPNPFCYAYAQNYQAIKYCRLDRVGMSPPALLAQIKAVLVAGLPCMFGFTAYKSIHDPDNVAQGHIPYPTRNDVMEGGHALVAVGYDDHHVIESADDPDNPSVGAILVRNSWGIEWGKGGYGWLPYDYVLGGLTADWWVLLKAEWLNNNTSFGGESAAWTSRVGSRDRKRTR